MKLDENMRYPHPVLSQYSADYASGEFGCAFEQNITSGGELRIASHLQITNAALLDLIKSQKAAAGYFVVCRRTYFNQLQEAPLGDAEKFFDVSRFFGMVTLRPVVWTLAPVEDFSSPLFDKEFGASVSVAKGSVIALGPEFKFSMDQKKYKPFDSIFELAQSDKVAPGTVEVDPDGDRITILAEAKTFKALADIRNMPGVRGMLLNAVYMPAVMDVIARLQTGQSGLQSRKWYRVFKAKCDDLAIDPVSSSKSPLSIAQTLLLAPLQKSISLVEKL